MEGLSIFLNTVTLPIIEPLPTDDVESDLVQMGVNII